MDNLYDTRSREVRAIHNRLYEIATKHWKESWVELEKPEHYGWYKEWVLNERFEDNAVYQEILNAISVPAWGTTKIKADKRWNWDFINKPYRTYYGFRSLADYELYKLSDKAILEFSRAFSTEIHSRYRHGTYYCMLPLSCFKVRYRKAYVTHRRVPIPEVERERAYLEQRLLSNELYRFAVYPNRRRYRYFENASFKSVRYRAKRMLSEAVKEGTYLSIEEHPNWPTADKY